MFSSPADWTPEALESARTELRRRGLNDSGVPPPIKPERDGDRPDIYEYFGTYSNRDARLLLDAFISGDVEYTLDLDKMRLVEMTAFQAASGGTFGTGVGMAIGVHTDDCERAMEIRQRVFKMTP